MYASNLALKQRPVHFTVALVNDRTLTCPAYPDECAWAAVHLDGVEIHRITADALAAAPKDELTRLANALIPGRSENPDLPQGDRERGEWHECAVTVAESGRTIRFEPAPEQVERVRICERDGEEIAYWVDSEFEEDAVECLGAAIGALAGGALPPTIDAAASRGTQ